MKLDKKILYLTLYWILYSGLIEIYIIRTPFIPIVADFLLIILLLKKTAFKVSQIKKSLGYVIPTIIYLFITLGTISSLLNLIAVPTYLWGLHYYIRYWILLICAHKTFNKFDVLKIKCILYKATYINIILCIIQVAMGIKGDPLGGTFSGGNAEIALLIIIMTIIVSCDYFYKYISLKKALLIVCGFLFIAILGEIKFLYFVIPICIYGCYIFIKRFSIKPIIILVILFFTFIPIMKGILSLYYDRNYVEMVFDENKIPNKQYHCYNYAGHHMPKVFPDSGYKFTDLFHEMFEPCDQLKQTYLTLGIKEKEYVSCHFRFVNALEKFENTFFENYLKKPEDRERLIKRCKEGIKEVIEMNPNKGIYIFSDSKIFLNSLKDLPVKVLPHNDIAHISENVKSNAAFKTVFDLYVMSKGNAVYRFQAPELYSISHYALLAATIGDIPFNNINV